MALITLNNIFLAFGGPTLLEAVNLSVDGGERACLIGRNGAGKSSLLGVIAGRIQADGGERVIAPGQGIGWLRQEVPDDIRGSLFEVVAGGLGDLAALVGEYHRLSLALHQQPSDALYRQLAQVQHELEAREGWQAGQRVETVLSRLGLPPEERFETLSGGGKRRVMLARALVAEPGILLLDEPTNHLDMDSIAWLESFLLGYRGALVFVTHDRVFLQRLATRILELDRGQLRDWPGDYTNYLRRRDERLNAEAKENERFDKRLAEEERWIRKGIEARRTRNEGRVRALLSMREERRARRDLEGRVQLGLQKAEASGRLVAEAEHISYAWDGRPIVKDFSTLVLRGDKIGVMGPNGIGKTTLLNLLLGRLAPDSGHLRLGQRVEVAYFDQMRTQLDEEKSVQDNVADGSDWIRGSGRAKHVMGYLQEFLFTPERARTPVKALSGGERNRLLLARLFAKPANVLVLDEPTNDLDSDTLELLEELLIDYQGTLLLVSHDRAFLDNVVTSCLVFEGEGRVREYVGGYQDWLRQRPQPSPASQRSQPAAEKVRESRPRPSESRLSYKEQQELQTLPARIEGLEAELTQGQTALADPGFYQRPGEEIAALREKLGRLETELDLAYERWEALEARRG